MWKNGRQDGQGEFFKDNVWRKGIWSEGNRIEWISDTPGSPAEPASHFS
jgi:hypothetical protein